MIPYFLVLSFVTYWAILEDKALNRKAFLIPLLTLTLFAGIRSSRVGSDSETYVTLFNESTITGAFVIKEDIEIGYQVFEYVLSLLTNNYFWLFLITGFIVVFCYLIIIRKFSNNYWLSLFFFITLGSYTFFFNGLRQGIAIAIFTLSLPYLLNRKIIPYLMVCLLASLFHNSALAAIPFYFIVNLRIKIIYKIIATLLISLFSSSLLVKYIASTNERYEGYTKVSDEAGGLVVLSFHILLMLSMYIIMYIYKIKDKNFIKILTFYMSGVAFIIPIALLGTDPSGPQRILNYFTWTLILLLPFILERVKNIYVNITAITLSIVYFVLTTSSFSDLTPYIINPIFEKL